ncbi:ABC transporter substrate-binding protein [Agrobacterium tumefaciens]|uniref:ABC transporter substrate-binding protein n=1 Tax=Agrobacterium tumefaciens TaxID=358 RepID=UPI0012B947E9|nr:ABC transporter substrate-binding protein [Agrobacterium tumefaciens]MQB08017.1 ABC transporter substrate-binding protein [Agrobacterium tumefaciens]
MTGSENKTLGLTIKRRTLLTAMLGGAAAIQFAGVGPALAQSTKVRVGLSLAHTGWAAAYDVGYALGLQMAFSEANAKGGAGGKFMIDVIEGNDTASSSVEAIKSAEGLLEQGVDVLFTSCDATSSVAAGRSGQKKGVLMFAGTSTQVDVPKKVGDWMYLSNFSDNVSGGSTGIYAAKDLGIKTAYLLKSSDNTFTEYVPEYFASTFEKYGGKVVGKGNYTFEQADFGGIIAEIKALPAEPDAIMTAAFEPDLPAFLRQARAAGIKSRIIGADGIDSPSFYALGDLVEGTTLVSNRMPVEGSKYQDVAKVFGQAHPDQVENSAWIVGYDAGLVLIEAIKNAGATDSASIRTALDKIKDFEVPNGKVTHAGFERRPLVPISFLEIKNGKGVFMKAATIDATDIPAPIM